MKEFDIRPKEIFNEYLRLAKIDSETYFKNVKKTTINCPACEFKGEHVFTKDSFDYCFENSVTDINLFENNTAFDDELNHELKKKENNKSNIENINLKDIIIYNYIKI